MESLSTLVDFINAPDFPCVMAKAVVSKGYFVQTEVSTVDVQAAVEKVREDFYKFVDHFISDQQTLSSYTVSFTHPKLKDFKKFNEFFWSFIRAFDEQDKMEYSHDPRVSNKPNSEKFSYSVKGEAFFMLVMHPGSPRFARGYSIPTVIFNAHQQFEDLRKKNIFEKVRDLIRKRDKSLQGFINPMLVNYGVKSEAYQYTGEVYPEAAECPFKRLHKWLKK